MSDMLLRCQCDETKPYIFVSYSHKDSAVVYPIIEEMHRRGYNVWFDSGIRSGNNWVRELAEHLNRATYFVAFLTHEYLASRYCLKEITTATNSDMGLLPVYLEEVDLPVDIQFLVVDCQALTYGRYANKDYFLDDYFDSINALLRKRGEEIPKAPPAKKTAKPKQNPSPYQLRQTQEPKKEPEPVRKETSGQSDVEWRDIGKELKAVMSGVLKGVRNSLPSSQTVQSGRNQTQPGQSAHSVWQPTEQEEPAPTRSETKETMPDRLPEQFQNAQPGALFSFGTFEGHILHWVLLARQGREYLLLSLNALQAGAMESYSPCQLQLPDCSGAGITFSFPYLPTVEDYRRIPEMNRQAFLIGTPKPVWWRLTNNPYATERGKTLAPDVAPNGKLNQKGHQAADRRIYYRPLIMVKLDVSGTSSLG